MVYPAIYNHRPQSGGTLIEVLIATLVLSVGLLGMAGLQTTAVRQSHGSYMRTQAAILASDMADRMRANTQGLADGDYNIDSTVNTYSSIPSCVSDATACPTSDTASYDAYAWTNPASAVSVASLLPSGKGKVSRAADGVVTVTVFWDEARTGASGTDCSGDTSVDLSCLTLQLRP